jgi:hypothetical protein
MKRLLLTTAGVVLCALAPTVSMAQSSTISGDLYVGKQVHPFHCTAVVELDGPTPETSTQIVSFTLMGGLMGQCWAMMIPNAPHDITQAGGEFTVRNFYIDTVSPGDCEGDLTGTVDGGVVSFNTTLPSVTASTSDCTIVGSLS